MNTQEERTELLFQYLNNYSHAVFMKRYQQADYYWKAIVLLETGEASPPQTKETE